MEAAKGGAVIPLDEDAVIYFCLPLAKNVAWGCIFMACWEWFRWERAKKKNRKT